MRALDLDVDVDAFLRLALPALLIPALMPFIRREFSLSPDRLANTNSSAAPLLWDDVVLAPGAQAFGRNRYAVLRGKRRPAVAVPGPNGRLRYARGSEPYRALSNVSVFEGL